MSDKKITKEEIVEKIKTMNHEELNSAYSTARMSSRLVTIFAVAIMFLVVTYFNIITMIVGSFFVYMFAHVAVGIDDTTKLIKNRILELADK